jgi:amino acid adenylation domain-containing protein
LDRKALRRALNRIIARHEILRTTFPLVGSEPVQLIAPAATSYFQLSEHDDSSQSGTQEFVNALLKQEAGTSFDLENGPLIRGRLYGLGRGEHVLLITVHHIVFDGWSRGIFLQELSALYTSYTRGEDDPLPLFEVQYADYAVWQRTRMEAGVHRKQGEFWRNTLAGASGVLELRTDRPRPKEHQYEGRLVENVLSDELSRELRELSKKHKTTLFMTVMAAWAALLGRISGQNDIVIGTPVANRRRVETKGMIGLFVNTLAIRFDLSGSPTVGELLRQAKERVTAAQEHQDIPFERVVEIAQAARSAAHSPLFQVMLSWQNEQGGLQLPGIDAQWATSAEQVASKFDLTLTFLQTQEQVASALTYPAALFERPTIERHMAYLRTLLEGMAADDTQRVDRLPILPEQERQQILQGWNATGAVCADATCQALFEKQVEKTPEAVAVVSGDRRLSYRELNRRANCLAHWLRDLGVRPDDPVAICVERSLEMVAGILGILKAGGAYVPLDPDHPAERLRLMIEQAQPVALLTQPDLLGLVRSPGELIPTIDISEHGEVWKESRESNPGNASIGLTPNHLAYVLYTSGSTGTPKGVMVEHRNLTNHLLWSDEKFYRRGGLGSPTLHSIGFDAIVTILFCPLLCGECVDVLPRGAELEAVSEAMSRGAQPYSLLKLTPSHLKLLNYMIAQAPEPKSPALAFSIGGEVLGPAEVLFWKRRFPEVRLINHFGPTETTVGCCACELTGPLDESSSIPIGRPSANAQIFILDRHGEPVPVGVTGELFVGGAGVSRGYLNHAGQTAERFLANPFSRQLGDRMYKTGDLGRWLADGNIEFVGRNDFQLKIRGFRIEAGEVEARLRDYRGVRDAVVVAREDQPGDKRLVAYYTAEPGGNPSSEQLRAHMAARLPEYMVPKAYERMDSLPLNRNGKLDRRALPAPGLVSSAVREYEAPVGELEVRIAQIWADALQVERVGRRDNFFELGGHSLLVLGIIERLRQAGLRVEVRALFTAPTVAALAESLRARDAEAERACEIRIPPNRIPRGCDSITPEMLPLVELTGAEISRILEAVPGGARNVQDIYPLAPLQEGVLFHHLMGGESDPYVVTNMFSFDSRARLDRYLAAFQAVIDRHDILRTGVVWEGVSEPVQVVWRKAILRVEEAAFEAGEGDRVTQLYQRYNPRTYRMDIRKAPLVDVVIAEDQEKGHWLMMQLRHHLSGDHVSQDVVREEIQAHLLGEADRLHPPQPFRNFVAQARLAGRNEEHEAFFRQLLSDVDEPTAPFGLMNVRGDGRGIGQAHITVEAGLARRIRDAARWFGVSAASLCHIAWAQVLARTSGRSDVVFGTVLFGRMQGGAGADVVTGPFINTLPVRIRIGADGAEEVVRQTHCQLAGLIVHEQAPLALAQKSSGVAPLAPLFTALLNYRHNATWGRPLSGKEQQAWEGIRAVFSEERTNYPCTMAVDDFGEGFGLTARVEARIEAKRVCEYMHTALESLTTALETAPERTVSTLEVLTERERQTVLHGWNQTREYFPRDKFIHELFEEQASSSPDAIAVVFDGAFLSYGELNRRANQLAHHLRSLGVKADARVGICMERGWEMVAGILAVMKAGGAYVPIEPTYPQERLRYMVEDSAPIAILTQGRLEALVSDLAGARPTCIVGSAPAPWDGQPEANPKAGGEELWPENLAYVIYTSGSTGTPKGVMVEHAGLVNRIVWMQRAYGLNGSDVVLQKTPFGFDVSVWEFFWPLSQGAPLVMALPEGHKDPAYLSATVQKHGVTTLHFVPSMLEAFLESADAERCSSLTRVVCSGEALPAALAGRFRKWLPSASLYNLYGPTEATVDVTAWNCPAELTDSTIPIGTPIANTQIYILNAHGQPAPVGVGGELYIGGVGVARGYLNRAEGTAKQFLPDPFASDAGARIYRTGDLAKWREDGDIEFLGRNDFQVKIRGVRIELGEIEERLQSHEGVRRAVVVAREEDDGHKRLVAYYTSTESGGSAEGRPSPELLRTWVASKLPEHMVPAAFVAIGSLPLTPSGKLDRQALPAPEEGRHVLSGYEAPRTPTEKAIAEIWAAVVKHDKVGRHDDFFEIGGDSIRAILLINRVQQKLGQVVHLSLVYDCPTVLTFAAFIDQNYPGAFSAPEKADLDSTKGAGHLPIGLDDVVRFRKLLPIRRNADKNGQEPNRAAIFVLSPPRSGSTLLRVMLGGHSRLFAPPELELLRFGTMAERRAAFGGRDGVFLEGAVRAVMAACDCTVDKAKGIIEEYEKGGAGTREFYAALQKWIGGRLLVDKTPTYAYDPEALRSAEHEFADTKYVHLIRHPGGMIRSFVEARMEQVFFSFPHEYPARQLAELAWVVGHQNILQFLENIPPERQQRVNFEDLVRRPEDTIKRLCRFLNLDFEATMLQPYEGGRERMTDGIYPESRMLGDIKFHQYQGIEQEPALRRTWEVSQFTRNVAEQLGLA